MKMRGHYWFRCGDFPSVYGLVQRFANPENVAKEFGEDEADALAKLNAWARPEAAAFLGFQPDPITAKAVKFRPLTERKAASQ